MTRETKVGLVVGTGIILLIGIVVSDHLASQQRGQQQTIAPPGYTDLANGQPRTIDPKGVSPLAESLPPAPVERMAPLPPANYDAQGNLIAPRDNRSVAVGLLNNGNTPDTLRTPGANAADAPGTPGTPDARNTDSEFAGDRNLPPGLTEALRRNNMLPEDPTPRLTNPDGGSTNYPNPTEPLIHHVQPGESLWAIAEKFYGSGQHYTEIARANADKLLPNGDVRAGVRLLIPNKVIVPPASPVQTDSRNAANDGDTSPASDAGQPRMKLVRVEAGDSLSGIASRTLGSIRHMQLIIDANRDQITDADDIKAGMTLRIPQLPAAPAANTPSAPPPGATRALPPASGPAAPGTPASPAPPTAPAAPANAKTYKVQARDTFSSIARARLGSDRRWKEIYELNKDRVDGPDSLREGVVLVLPPDAR